MLEAAYTHRHAYQRTDLGVLLRILLVSTGWHAYPTTLQLNALPLSLLFYPLAIAFLMADGIGHRFAFLFGVAILNASNSEAHTLCRVLHEHQSYEAASEN